MQAKPVSSSFLITICFILILITSCSTTKTMVVLLPNEYGPNGAVSLGEGDQTTLLDVPMTAAEVDTQGRIVKSTVTQDIVDKEFAQALAAQPPDPMKFILFFEEGSTELSHKSIDTLPALFKEVHSRQAIEVQITGHTDRLDSEASNDRLSIKRARSIKEMLIAKGLESEFIRVVGRGERELLVHTQDGVREPRNRRVEVTIR